MKGIAILACSLGATIAMVSPSKGAGCDYSTFPGKWAFYANIQPSGVRRCQLDLTANGNYTGTCQLFDLAGTNQNASHTVSGKFTTSNSTDPNFNCIMDGTMKTPEPVMYQLYGWLLQDAKSGSGAGFQQGPTKLSKVLTWTMIRH